VRTRPPLTAPLFRSDGQARLLAELFLSGVDELNLNELATRTGVAYSSVHREIGRLIDSGLLTQRRLGQARYVRPNADSPLTASVRALLLVSAGPVPLLAAALQGIAGVESAFLFGSFAARLRGQAGEAPRDIDVIVIGTPEPMTVYDACRRVGDQVGREVSPTVMTADELATASGFLAHVRSGPTVPVFGASPWPDAE
jgi:DNA-binding transcriptional ArsR family regulator